MMLREQIKKDIAKAIEESTNYGLLTTDIEVTRTSDSKFGDFSTNVALRIASSVIASGTKQSQKKIATPIDELRARNCC